MRIRADDEEDRGDYTEYGRPGAQQAQGEELPAVFLHPKNWKKRVVVWPHEKGKAGLYGSDGKPTAAVQNYSTQA